MPCILLRYRSGMVSNFGGRSEHYEGRNDKMPAIAWVGAATSIGCMIGGCHSRGSSAYHSADVVLEAHRRIS